MAIEVIGGGGGGDGDDGVIRWTGGRCADCRFWIREHPQLPPNIGNCVESPPHPTILLIPMSQPKMLQTRIMEQQTLVPQNFTVERTTNSTQGCGAFEPRA